MINYLFLFLVLAACGKALVEEDGREKEREDNTIDGTYSAILIPVNGIISAHVHGEAQVVKYGDEFSVRVDLKNAPTGQVTQHLHTGSFCPKATADINGDGFVDGYEARRHTGPMIVPLDGDLSTQHGGSEYRLAASYRYSRSSSYYLMLYDLHLPDEIVNDDLVKLSTRELPLERRAVSVYLRSSVRPGSTLEDLPLVCGILTRISDDPISEDDLEHESDEPRRIRRVSRHPVPLPSPEPRPIPETRDSWWDRIRERWWRWRSGGS